MECSKYDYEEIQGVSMMFPKDRWHTIISWKEMIHECLKCSRFWKECKETAHKIVKLLYKNDLDSK